MYTRSPAAPTVLPVSQGRTGSLGRVGIIGGGIAGLAAAYYLQKTGAEVELFEASASFGGLGASFRHDGHDLDRFYHVILPSDNHLLELCEELGVRHQVYWRKASLGFLYRKCLYSLRSPLDLLRFRAVPMWDRIRLGLTALYTTHVASSSGLDDVTSLKWLRKLSGRRACDRLWRPLLQAKFGDGCEEIPALWYWTSFNREKGTAQEVKGYVRGGYRTLADRLVSALRSAGVSLHLNTPVRTLDMVADGRPSVTTSFGTTEFDRVINAAPLADLSRIVAGGLLEDRVRPFASAIDYQGVVNVLVLLRRSLTPHYWIPVVDSGMPFQGIVETTRVLDLQDTGGYHLVYLLNYVHRTDPLFSRDPAGLAAEYVDALLRLFPELERQDICDAFVFKAPYVEPLYTPGYGRRKPPEELIPSRVYLATTSQIYPNVTSWNSSIGLAKEVVERIVQSPQRVG